MKALLRAAIATLLVGGTHVRADVREFLERYCITCHGEEEPKAGLVLSGLVNPSSTEAAYRRWVGIHDRVAAAEMPPTTAKRQPSEAERADVLSEIGAWLTDRDRQRQREQGRVPMRRLNRTEYEHTVRDLFALPGLQVRELLPGDGRLDGFEKASDALDISAAQIRKYMEVADVILDAAIATHDRPAPEKRRFRMLGSIDHLGQAVFPLKDGRVDLDRIRGLNNRSGVPELQAIAADSDALALLTQSRLGFTAAVPSFSVSLPGLYRIQTRIFSFRPGRNGELLPEPRGQYVELATGKRFLGFLDALSLQPTDHEMVAWLNTSEGIELNPTSLWPNYFHVLHPSTPALAAHIKWPGLAHPFHYRGPAVAVEFIDIEGPLHDQWPPESHRRLFGNLAFGPAEPGAGGNPLRRLGNRPRWTVSSEQPGTDLPVVIGAFLDRAFRRPASPE